jgi:hypothetical protein
LEAAQQAKNHQRREDKVDTSSAELSLTTDLKRGDSVTSKFAGGLRAAAGALSDQADASSAQVISGLGNRAAEVLNRSADYVDEMDLGQLKEDVVNQVRRNPGRSLLIAGAAGLILGALFRRR